MLPAGDRFDWYEPTFDDADDGRIPAFLAIALRARLGRGKGRNGYAECVTVERDGEVLAHVYGRSARPGEVHAVVTSSACDEVVPLIREHKRFRNHRVSRADVARDFVGDFAEWDARSVAFAEERGIKHLFFSDSDGGATRYLGAASSEVRHRLYKKSEQVWKMFPEKAAEFPPGVLRSELEVRPGKRDVKELAARLEPSEFYGLSDWASDYGRRFLDLDVERLPTHFRRPSDHSRMLFWLGRQYGPAIQERAADVGALAAVDELLVALGLPDLVSMSKREGD